ncbi:MAG: glycosyltransferase family 4 protein [Anaerolineae bacterium]|nr:glycosyltransferase family 4 protein [Anaerolineae bacterium]
MNGPKHVVMIGPFGLRPRMTMRVRALPLAKALVRRGHRVTVVLPPWQNPEDAGRAWEEEGVRIENVPLPRGVPGWFQVRLAATLVRRSRALEPDVIHAFKPKAYAGLAHLALVRHAPVVVDTDDWEGPGGWNDRGDYSPLLRRFFTWQERWGLRHADAVTVASRALQTLVWSLGGPPERVFYLPNGVAAMPAAPGAAVHERPTVLLYTRFFEYDLDRLWRVMRTVRERRNEARFLVVGRGFDHEEDRLLALAHRAGWRVIRSEDDDAAATYRVPDADLVYAGWGTAEKLSACFAAADLAIYPFDDTLLNRTKCPMKLMDLLAAGIPVIADAVGQLAEVIEHSETGMLIRPGDDAGFAEAMVTLLADREELARMGVAAQREVTRRFSWERLADTAAAAYRYAVSRS